MTEELVFLPLGGAGEIGMNLGLYGFGDDRSRKWIMVDLGIGFTGGRLPGVDIVLPDPAFLKGEDLLGIVLTHGHEDHIGAVLDLYPRVKAPIYATPFTAALLRAKRGETLGAATELNMTTVPLGGSIELGPFDIRFISVAHSIPESNALAIMTPAGRVLHTGDWRLDPEPVVGAVTDEAALREVGKAGVDAMICDSTNALREGESPSEGEIGRNLATLIAEAPNRVAVTIFASNVARIRSVALAAQAAGRQVVASGRSMWRMIEVATELGYLDGLPGFQDQNAFGYLPRDKVVLLCTGSQGEDRAALSRIARDDHPEITLAKGDRVIFSSRAIPGNEKSVGGVVNALIMAGIEVITDRTHLVHVTGHPRRDELRRMYDWVKPKLLVPVHGEALHMHEQADLARESGIPEVAMIEDGRILRLLPGPAEIVDEVPVGMLARDGRLLIPSTDVSYRERTKLTEAGVVLVSFALDERGDLQSDVEVEAIGLPGEGTMFDAADAALEAAISTLDSLPRARRRDDEKVSESIRRAVRNTLYQTWGKRPACSVLVSWV